MQAFIRSVADQGGRGKRTKGRTGASLPFTFRAYESVNSFMSGAHAYKLRCNFLNSFNALIYPALRAEVGHTPPPPTSFGCLVPRPNVTQLRVDYITATRKRSGDVIHPQLHNIGFGYETTFGDRRPLYRTPLSKIQYTGLYVGLAP